ncbi:MAG: YajQ family cyclic di-GMP-binding protein [Proteobacteria bacterium]|nr:YajQ family cyclic di-GMP-binding protein [Pseudomonadota bacterium]
MPSFDVVSEVDLHELTNAVDQTNREAGNRFDLKGANAKVEQKQRELTIVANSEFHIHQVLDIFQGKLSKRGIDIDCLEIGEVQKSINAARQLIVAKHGIDKDTARKIVKLVKELKLKVQAQVQQEQVRITGKNRDDLQNAISSLKKAQFDLPFQFTNFRD